MAALVLLFLLVSFALSARITPSNNGSDTAVFREEVPPTVQFPPTHGTDLCIHDPSIILFEDTFYSYSVGPQITIHEASSLDGPWTETGSVLGGESIIAKGDRTAPWAANTIQLGDTFYCYYSVSNAGCRDSAVGVATSDHPGPGNWTDHGPIIQSGTGQGCDEYPFDQSNAIDPAVLVDVDGSAYLSFGSFWSGIWQVQINSDYISFDNDTSADARHLVSEEGAGSTSVCGDTSGWHPIEGGFVSYHAPFYYLWYSWGTCCEFADPATHSNGKEYRIRVGRSDNARGPFVDKQNIDLADGGGETIYGSNGEVFAPGGQGILTDPFSDILYYHYLNTSISYDFGEARLGYNRLNYVDGWPVAFY
ncbi:glycosyl hydrolase [Aspergillus californicus]